jgi:hypothetical protein
VLDPDALDPTGMLRAWNETYSDGWGGSTSNSTTTSESITETPVDVPVLGQELSSVQFRSIEEQVFRAMQRLFLQQDRQCAARLVGRQTPVFLQTFDVHPALATGERVMRYRQQLIERWPFYLPFREAMRRISEREQRLLASVVAPNPALEPSTARRRIASRTARESQ